MARRLVLACGVVSLLVVVVAAQGPPRVLDQSSPAADSPVPITYAVGGSVDQVVSQTVTAGVDGRLRDVRVPIGCTDGELVLEIRDVNVLGQPDPTVLAHETFRAEDFPVPVTADMRPLRLTGRPVRLAAGDTFAISLSNPTGSCGVWPGPLGDPYAGGTGWLDANDGPIVPLALGFGRDDIPFQTFMQVH